MTEGERLQKDGMTAETGADPGDGVGGAAQRAGELSQGGTGDQAGGDRSQQPGPLAVVGDCEGLTREGPFAGQTAEPWNTPALRGGKEAVP